MMKFSHLRGRAEYARFVDPDAKYASKGQQQKLKDTHTIETAQ